MKLSARLQRIADHLPPGCKFADIGSDHALLPVYAVKKGFATSAVAGEVNEGPLDAARRQVAEAGEQQRISVRKGDGLAVIQPDEVDTITIAGMGGALIASILTDGMDKLSSVKRLVLQPNVGEDLVRRWLLQHGWLLNREVILEEDGKIYEIIIADAAGSPEEADHMNRDLYGDRVLCGGEVTLTKELLLLMGPHLIDNPNEVFFAKWESEIRKLERIQASVAASTQASSKQKEEEFKRLIEQLKGVLACLRKVKL